MNLQRRNHYLAACLQNGFIDQTGKVWVKFAAAALQGMVTTAARHSEDSIDERVVLLAAEYADAMLKLSKTLMDPIEIDPNQLGKENQSPKNVNETKPG